jgi:alanine dehydrogenase
MLSKAKHRCLAKTARSRRNHASVEIGEVVAGKKPGRTSSEEITLYKSVGIAVQDVAAVRLVYEKALRQNAGVNVEI